MPVGYATRGPVREFRYGSRQEEIAEVLQNAEGSMQQNGCGYYW